VQLGFQPLDFASVSLDLQKAILIGSTAAVGSCLGGSFGGNAEGLALSVAAVGVALGVQLAVEAGQLVLL
jgi:hypothetical protein